MSNKIHELRTQRNMSQAELARLIGVGTPQISRLERGIHALSVERAEQIGAALGISASAVLGMSGASDLPPSNGVVVAMEGASGERMQENLPIFGTALGCLRMIDDEAIEQTTLNQGDIVQYVKRPVILNGRSDAYGLYVQGQSMEPVHLAGDLILVETKRPARIGDDVIVYLRPNGDDDDGERARGVLIKRLIRRTSGYVELQQFNPETSFKVPADDVVRIDRVMRMVDLIS